MSSDDDTDVMLDAIAVVRLLLEDQGVAAQAMVMSTRDPLGLASASCALAATMMGTIPDEAERLRALDRMTLGVVDP